MAFLVLLLPAMAVMRLAAAVVGEAKAAVAARSDLWSSATLSSMELRGTDLKTPPEASGFNDLGLFVSGPEESLQSNQTVVGEARAARPNIMILLANMVHRTSIDGSADLPLNTDNAGDPDFSNGEVVVTPSGLRITSMPWSLKVEWDKVFAANGYQIRSRIKGAQDCWVLYGQEWEYSVRTAIADCGSAWTGTVIALARPTNPKGPNNLHTEARGGGVYLSWYSRNYKKNDPSRLTGMLSSTTTSHGVAFLFPGTWHFQFYVVATSGDLDSIRSSVVVPRVCAGFKGK
ncbi:hypothetical protein Micbo1qcDRAFT_179986 [Microdochium bolleyi]|uniref:Uncharacterized protein n=1 Tax=Microdochium bolleyi TaxID=196109 RepID=A0A136INF8_9PEZI|nr:hypothetical protein Micbo1qcDRAFT_179986 [Microdochium bolleyi]